MAKYNNLKRAELNNDYLHTNSTTHEFLFGALAELVDNSRDAKAKNLKIYTEMRPDFRGKRLLCFLDDGNGMNPEEAEGIMTFGKSYKKGTDSDLIGQYGNGLKSGSMRVGKDLILFTKKKGLLTCVFLSRTFNESERNEFVVVPCPSFSAKDKQPVYSKKIDMETAIEKHNLEIELIYKYSPFRDSDALMHQFDKIKGESGTLVIIFNLKLLEDATTELDFDSVPDDIVMPNFEVDYDRKSQNEHKSFRAYLSILYSNPRMKIYIQNQKVQTKLLNRSLHTPIRYEYVSKKFKANAQKDVNDALEKIKSVREKLREADSKYSDFASRFGKSKNQNDTKQLAFLRREKEDAESALKTAELEHEKKNKISKDPKKLNLIFGINVYNRAADGFFIYNCNRLILMYEYTSKHKQIKDNSFNYSGIVGIVNVPYLVLNPRHNKQDLADSQEQKALLSALGDCMEIYVKDLYSKHDIRLDSQFWSKYGYMDNSKDLPSNEENFLKMRLIKTQIYAQCDECLKWRFLDYNRKFLNPNSINSEWKCQDNLEYGRDNCRAIEIFPDFETGEFKIEPRRTETYEDDSKKSSQSLMKKQVSINEGSTASLKYSSSNQNFASLVQKQNNVIVNKSVPPIQFESFRNDDEFINVSKKRHAESNSKQENKKRNLGSESSESESENSFNSKNDPDFKLRKSSSHRSRSSTKKSKSSKNGTSRKNLNDDEDSNNSNSEMQQQQQSNNNNNNDNDNQSDDEMNYSNGNHPIIETEVLDCPRSNLVKNEPATSSQTINKELLQTRSSPKINNFNSENNLEILFYKYRDWIKMILSMINDYEKITEIESMSLQDIVDMSIHEIFNKFQDVMEQRRNQQIRRKIKKFKDNYKLLLENSLRNEGFEETKIREIINASLET